MSVENLKKYGKLCAEDEKVREKAKTIGLQDLEGHIAYAKSLGLEISKEDFEALAKEAGLDGKSELSEDDLKKVAGGAVNLLSTVRSILIAPPMSSVVLGPNADQGRW
jgi:predicted ribosomally synthesized peptide with nif11-like leader